MQEMHTCFPGAQGAGGLWVSPARATKQDPSSTKSGFLKIINEECQ